jgi:RNA polymerase sigma-70 factor (ECF subfamily)
MDQVANNQIITNLRTGDEYYFELVYKTFFAGLCSFSSQYVPLEEAKEIVQETMLWLWEHRTSLIPELSLKSLLFTIVKNKALNRITQDATKSKVYQKLEQKYRQQFNDPDFYLQKELTSLFNDALDKLPVEYRKAFEMNRFEKLTHKEIAEKLNVSPQTVNYRIGQALKILRKALKDYLPLFFLYGTTFRAILEE